MIQENPYYMSDDIKFYSILSYASLIFLISFILLKNYNLIIYNLIIIVWFNIKIEIITSRLHTNKQYEEIVFKNER